ncbi:MAG: DUF1801 domain-containing protein [Candidatus Kapaibacterium sp.]|jgi:hypothetical protein
MKPTTVEEYLQSLPQDRRDALQQLRAVICEHLPEGFEECISYGMIGYVVPKSIYPAGYHCDTSLPLPFMSIASQKNFIALYNMALYADTPLYDWFIAEYPKHSSRKLDMGKSCVRFKHGTELPLALIGELTRRVSVSTWIAMYEKMKG